MANTLLYESVRHFLLFEEVFLPRSDRMVTLGLRGLIGSSMPNDRYYLIITDFGIDRNRDGLIMGPSRTGERRQLPVRKTLGYRFFVK